jgi:hypothetical protein
MRKITLIVLLISLYSSAQLGTDAPWMTQLQTAKSNGQPTFEQIKSAGEAYWATHDKDAKGSGYKPFQRWLERAKPFLKADGTLQTVQDIQEQLQTANFSKSGNEDDSNWNPVGPFDYEQTSSWSPGKGRVNTLAVDPNNPDIYYLGTPGGGMWKSTDAGQNWTAQTDFLSQIGVSAIAVDPKDSKTIYIGTGDDDAGDTPSIGLMKSTDGGATFDHTGLTFSGAAANISEVYVDPTNSENIYISSNQGFYKSMNAGKTVTRTFSGNVKDIKLKPGNSQVIYMATNRAFYKSTNNGESFKEVTQGLPSGISRIVIAVTEADDNRVYLLAVNNNNELLGLYVSKNSGASFSRFDDGTDLLESTQAWYDLALEVDQTNANIVYTGCLNVWKSTNGGRKFSRLNTWNSPQDPAYTHADIHQIREFNGELFVMSDGGIYRSLDGGDAFADLSNGLQIGQFYRVAVGSDSSANIAGGLQDNGGFTTGGGTWRNFHGADGMDAGVSPTNSNVRYSFTQFGGGLYFTSNAGETIQNTIQGPARGNWITPLKTDSKGTIYAGYNKLYKVENGEFKALSTSFAENLSVIEIDPNNDDTIYVAYDKQLFRSTDAGNNFVWISELPGPITSIEVNHNNNNIVYVSTAYAVGKVMRSNDMGESFTDISANLPFLGKNTLAHHINSADNAVFVGTTIGVYRYTEMTGEWEIYSNNLPNVNVRDLEINATDQILTAATYGRGVWQTGLTVTQPDRDVALKSIASTTGKVDCSALDLSLLVQNNGKEVVNSIDVVYSINDGEQISTTFDMSLAPQEETTIMLPENNLEPGSYEVKVDVSTKGDAFLSNNFKRFYFIQNMGSQINDSYGFENRSLVSVNEGSNGKLWERGMPTGRNLNSAAAGNKVYATNLDGEYPDLTISYLYTGCYNLSQAANSIIKFDMAYDLEENWDVLYIEYSTNHGESWDVLGDATAPDWYNSSRDNTGSNCFNCKGGQWTGTNTTMTTYSYPLAELQGSPDVVFRFVFQSDQSVHQEGVVLDNLVVTGTLRNTTSEDVLFSVFPNPSDGQFNLQWKMDAAFGCRVYDLSGKLILEKLNNTGQDHQLDLSQVATGMYFLKITSQGNTVTKKLMKR